MRQCWQAGQAHALTRLPAQLFSAGGNLFKTDKRSLNFLHCSHWQGPAEQALGQRRQP